jgi:acetylornithine/succinyldiaminopimelate/putrescine aminotransferase
MTEKQMAKKQLATVNDYKNTFSSKQGKRVLYDLMQNGHVLNSTMVQGASPSDVCVKEGERNAVLRILNTLKMDTKKFYEFINTMEEANE